jgi:hypothetical protein
MQKAHQQDRYKKGTKLVNHDDSQANAFSLEDRRRVLCVFEHLLNSGSQAKLLAEARCLAMSGGFDHTQLFQVAEMLASWMIREAHLLQRFNPETSFAGMGR